MLYQQYLHLCLELGWSLDNVSLATKDAVGYWNGEINFTCWTMLRFFEHRYPYLAISKLLLILASQHLNGLCMLYLWNGQALMLVLNVGGDWGFLKKVKVKFGARAIWWSYRRYMYYWSWLHHFILPGIYAASCDTYATDKLECWIWAIGFGCLRRLIIFLASVLWLPYLSY